MRYITHPLALLFSPSYSSSFPSSSPSSTASPFPHPGLLSSFSSPSSPPQNNILPPLKGNPRQHLKALKEVTSCSGEPSLQNSLEMAMRALKLAPPIFLRVGGVLGDKRYNKSFSLVARICQSKFCHRILGRKCMDVCREHERGLYSESCTRCFLFHHHSTYVVACTCPSLDPSKSILSH